MKYFYIQLIFIVRRRVVYGTGSYGIPTIVVVLLLLVVVVVVIVVVVVVVVVVWEGNLIRTL